MDSVKTGPISIVIPAHNEAAVIGRCLKGILDGAKPGDLEIIVVANGCTDATAQTARLYGNDVKVVETEVASKSNALNLGNSAAWGFPRIFVDADVVLDIEAIRQIANTLAMSDGILAAAPLLKVNCEGRPWSIRAYYDIWLGLPYCRTGMIGSGVYGVSELGLRRLGEFPKITADDAYSRLSFAPDERVTIDTCSFTVTPPKTISKLVDIKTRSHFGNVELRRQYPQLWQNEIGGHSSGLLKLALNPMRWPALAVYMYVKFATRRRVKERFARQEINKWERDDSSRETVPTGPGGAGL